MSRPWMPLYVADYLADTAHLSAAESGAYLHLIMHYWRHGGLPNNDELLRRVSRMTRGEWRSSKTILAAFFSDGWRHKRIELELTEAERLSAAGRRGGLASGAARRAKAERSLNDPANDQANDQPTNGEALQPPSPESFSDEKLSRECADAWPEGYQEIFWKAYPRRIGRKAALDRLDAIARSGAVAWPVLIGAVRRFAASVKGKDIEFVAHPATWLDAGRWDDELPAAATYCSAPQAVPGRIYLTPESPQWARYAARWRGLNGKATGPPTGRDGGWWFEKEHESVPAE
jgi:uncharacterized protein YdaU (DUF1376 family)